MNSELAEGLRAAIRLRVDNAYDTFYHTLVRFLSSLRYRDKASMVTLLSISHSVAVLILKMHSDCISVAQVVLCSATKATAAEISGACST